VQPFDLAFDLNSYSDFDFSNFPKLFLIIAGSIDSSQLPSQSTNSLDVSIFSDIERLSQEFRQFQSTFGQNVRELTSFKASAADEMERLSENINELQELVHN
jgi:hypothetical protein